MSEPNFTLIFAARTVHDTFKRDLDRGYKTRDKEFAVDLLGKALNDLPDADVGALIIRLTERAYEEIAPPPPGDTRPVYNIDKDLVLAISLLETLKVKS